MAREAERARLRAAKQRAELQKQQMQQEQQQEARRAAQQEQHMEQPQKVTCHLLSEKIKETSSSVIGSPVVLFTSSGLA